MPINQFLEYQGQLSLYIAQYPLFSKMSARDFYELPENLKKFEKKLEIFDRKNLLEAAGMI